ncbi:MAG: IS1 family transposase [Gammaproteobacteria bacterium]|nr:IS1 family transposase [Gammaproteobacteria bacterium]
MNQLPTAKRAQILHLLAEGCSMRSTSRLADVSINTVTKLLEDAGRACILLHDELVRGIKGYRRIQCDEIWSYVYAKNKNLAKIESEPIDWAGSIWTWTALDAESKLIVSWLVGERDAEHAISFMTDLRDRVDDPVQITTDGFHPYEEAVEYAFGGDVDFAQLVKPPLGVKEPNKKVVRIGDPDLDYVNTSLVERHNLTIRMQNRRFTRLTNAYSRKARNHVMSLALQFVWYNFCQIHSTISVTPAMEAGLDSTVRDPEWIVAKIDEIAPKPNRPKKYKKKAK